MARQHSRSRTRSAAAHAVEKVSQTAEQSSDMAQDTMRRTRARIAEGVQQSMEAGSRRFGVLGEQAFQAWMRTSNETLQHVLELNVELASWSREQLDDSIGAVRSLSQCRSFGDAYGVQLGLMQSSMENSLRHANKVLSLTANVMSAGARAAQPQAAD